KYAPERIAAFVLGGQHPYERRLPESSRLDGADPETFLAALCARLNLNPATIPPAIREEFMANDFRALAAAQQDQFSVEDVLPSMAMPVLLYAGDTDPVHAGVQKCAQSLKNGEFLSLHGLDHGTAFRNSELVLPHVSRFLRGSTKSPLRR